MVRPRTRGVAIRVYLADGSPQGLRIVERMGWTGLCLAFARADYQVVRQREELLRTGVYVLAGPEAEDATSMRVYIGEGDAVRTRLDQHHRDKEFWTDAYVLTTTDNSLNKAQIRYLESRLLELAREAEVATIDNGTAPPLTWLSEPDTAVMDSYLDYGLALLPLLGVSVFELVEEVIPPALVLPGSRGEAPLPGAEMSAPGDQTVDRPTLFLSTVQTEARGRDESRGFVVYEGAVARRQENVMQKGYKQLRRQLIEDGILVPLNEQQFRLVKNYVFDSPSAAASVLSGGSKNGRTEWKTRDGDTLKALEERGLDAAPLTDGDDVGLASAPPSVAGGQDGALAPVDVWAGERPN